MNDFLWLAAIGAAGWWFYKRPAAEVQTSANGDGEAPAADALLAAKRALRAYLDLNYKLPAGASLAAALSGSNFAVRADQLPTDPPYPAGTIILIDNVGRSRLEALALAAGNRTLPIVGTGSPPSDSSTSLAQALAAMAAFLAPLAPAGGYAEGDSTGSAIVRSGKLVPMTLYSQWQMLRSAIQQAGG